MSDRFVLGRHKPIGETGRRAEGHLTKRLKGEATRASGNMLGDKGDVRVGRDWLAEGKATEAGSYSVKHEELAKIAREALAVGKEPVFAVTFVTGSGLPKPLGAWVMIPEDLFEEIKQMYEDRK